MQNAKTCAAVCTGTAPPCVAHKNIQADQAHVLMCVTWCLLERARRRMRPRVLHVYACGCAHVSGTPKCCTSKHLPNLLERFFVGHLGCRAGVHGRMCFCVLHMATKIVLSLKVTQSQVEPLKVTQTNVELLQKC